MQLLTVFIVDDYRNHGVKVTIN